MGTSKTTLFDDYQNRLAGFAKALAHPARIAILQQIAQTDSCICGELVADLGLAQPTISQHLKALKHAGLIKGSVEGVRVCYCLDREAWSRLQDCFSDLFNDILSNNSQSTCC